MEDTLCSVDIISNPSEDATIGEAKEIWSVLEKSLVSTGGFGLSACQIGILKKVGYVKYDGKEYKLLNTKIIKKSNPFIHYNEGCLSMPKNGDYIRINTERYSNIMVQDDNLGTVYLDESDGTQGAGANAVPAALADGRVHHRGVVRVFLADQVARAGRHRRALTGVALLRMALLEIDGGHLRRHLPPPLPAEPAPGHLPGLPTRGTLTVSRNGRVTSLPGLRCVLPGL